MLEQFGLTIRRALTLNYLLGGYNGRLFLIYHELMTEENLREDAQKQTQKLAS